MHPLEFVLGSEKHLNTNYNTVSCTDMDWISSYDIQKSSYYVMDRDVSPFSKDKHFTSCNLWTDAEEKLIVDWTDS